VDASSWYSVPMYVVATCFRFSRGYERWQQSDSSGQPVRLSQLSAWLSLFIIRDFIFDPSPPPSPPPVHVVAVLSFKPIARIGPRHSVQTQPTGRGEFMNSSFHRCCVERVAVLAAPLVCAVGCALHLVSVRSHSARPRRSCRVKRGPSSHWSVSF